MNALCNGNLKQGDRPLSRSAANTQAAGMHAIGTNTGLRSFSQQIGVH